MSENKEKAPLISIVIPIYNVEKYLSACIDSVLAQTYTNLEVILVDDGSTDYCGAICDRYGEKDSRIIVIHQKNKGLSGARNSAIDVAKGQYIGFVDSDDTIEPKMFEILLGNIQKYNAKVSICGRKNVDEKVNITKIRYVHDTELLMDGKNAIIEMNSHKSFDMSSCDKLFAIELWKDIRYPEGKISEDYFVIFHLLDKAKRIVWTPEPLYNYLQRNNSISRNDIIKQDFIEASERQMLYIQEKYPDIDFVGKSAYASACLTIYDLYLKRKLKCPSNVKKSFQEIVKSCLYSIKINSTLSINKKFQAYLFVASPYLYNIVFRIFKKIHGEL